MEIKEFRELYPAYDDLPDEQVSALLFDKYYMGTKRESTGEIWTQDEWRNEFLGPHIATATGDATTREALGHPPPVEQSLGLLDPPGAIGTGPTTTPPPTLPIPSSEQKFLGGMSFPVEESLPILGAVAGSAATGGFGPAALTLGGALTGAAGAATGAITGSAAEQFGREMRTGEEIPFEQMTGEMATQGALAGAGEMLGFAGGKALSPILAPWAKKLAKSGDAQAAQKLVEKGFAISPDQINKGKVAAGVQWIVDTLPPGKWITRKHRTKLGQMLTAERFALIDESLGLPQPGTGRIFKGKMDAAFVEAEKVANDLVDEKGIILDAQYVTEWAEGVTGVGNLNKFLHDKDAVLGLGDVHLERFLKQAIKNPSYRNFNEVKKRVWNGFNALGADEKAARGRLKSALEWDLGESMPQVLGLWEEATKAGRDLRLVSKANLVDGIFEQAMVYDQTTEEMIFSPLMFERSMKKGRNRLERLFRDDPGALDAIDAFVDKTKRLLVDTQRLRKSNPASLTDLGVASIPGVAIRTLGGGPALAAGGIVVPAGLGAIMARSVMNPKGLMRQWLTTGIEAPLLRQAARRGIQSGLPAALQEAEPFAERAFEALK